MAKETGGDTVHVAYCDWCGSPVGVVYTKENTPVYCCTKCRHEAIKAEEDYVRTTFGRIE